MRNAFPCRRCPLPLLYVRITSHPPAPPVAQRTRIDIIGTHSILLLYYIYYKYNNIFCLSHSLFGRYERYANKLSQGVLSKGMYTPWGLPVAVYGSMAVQNCPELTVVPVYGYQGCQADYDCPCLCMPMAAKAVCGFLWLFMSVKVFYGFQDCQGCL